MDKNLELIKHFHQRAVWISVSISLFLFVCGVLITMEYIDGKFDSLEYAAACQSRGGVVFESNCYSENPLGLRIFDVK